VLTKIAVVLVLVLAALAGFIATRPAEFSVSRARTIAASADVAHAYVNDFKKWPAWSPWEKLDAGMKRELSGAAVGTGAAYHWMGNKKVGEGRMTITDSRPPLNVTIRLEFIKPWTATNTTRFDFAPDGTGTKVTWTMSGHKNFMAKAFCLFMDMDKMVGGDFEKGLAQLGSVTAAAPQPPAPTGSGAAADM
jgi:hypothetical protein